MLKLTLRFVCIVLLVVACADSALAEDPALPDRRDPALDQPATLTTGRGVYSRLWMVLEVVGGRRLAAPWRGGGRMVLFHFPQSQRPDADSRVRAIVDGPDPMAHD